MDQPTNRRGPILATGRRLTGQRGHPGVRLTAAGVPHASFYHDFALKDARGCAPRDAFMTE